MERIEGSHDPHHYSLRTTIQIYYELTTYLCRQGPQLSTCATIRQLWLRSSNTHLFDSSASMQRELNHICGQESRTSAVITYRSAYDIDNMPGSHGLYELALDAIRHAELAHPAGPLLESFLENAVDSNSAASHMLNRASEDAHQLLGLTEFLQDWNLVLCECKHRIKPQTSSFR